MRPLDPINEHRMYRAGPMLLFENHGNLSLEEAKRVVGVYSQVIAEEGYVHLLLDLTDSQEVDGKTRRYLAEWGKANSARIAIAVVGGNMVFRTTFTLIINAVRLISGQPLAVAFCRSRKDAQAWLGTQKLAPAPAARS